MKDATHILSRITIPAFVSAGLIVAGVLYLFDQQDTAHLVLLVTLSLGSIPLAIDIFQSLRERHFGVDVIAIVAIGTSLFLGEYLPGTVILLMLSGGEALEEFALKRARKELTDLFSRAPQIAHRQEGDVLREVSVDDLLVGDIVVVKPGETIPVDGQVMSGSAMVDESALTGESVPVRRSVGLRVMSGSVSTDALLTVRTLVPSSESTYSHIIRLVQEAEETKAPFVRLADRYSVWFTAATFVLALTAWFLSHDPIRLLAVLVVATPCPLILATPIAFAAGISTAAKRGIIIRNGGALEKLGEARSFVFDKTGTITLGVPTVSSVQVYTNVTEHDVLQIASSLDLLSAHVLARALVQDALKREIPALKVESFTEKFGEGVSGVIHDKTYRLGRLAFLRSTGVTVTEEQEMLHVQSQEQGQITVYLAEGTTLIGAIFFADTLRGNVKNLFAYLQTLGMKHVRMLTGDRRAVALKIAQGIGISADDVRAECLPEDKVREVKQLHETAGPVVMVGDGVNDAPAIATADVGIAMGAGGHTAASQAGDVVILVDDIQRVGEVLCIGHRVLGIAKESIFIGIGLSLVLMVLAALGFIPPVVGAMLQEVIDVVVILNALRVLLVRCELTVA